MRLHRMTRTLIDNGDELVSRPEAVTQKLDILPGMMTEAGIIQAAATTGPANGPRPASSTPATCWKPSSQSFI